MQKKIDSRILYGWKKIADYLGCCTVTAKKYHKQHSLPVKKLPHKVMAVTSSLDTWVNNFKKL